MDITKVRIKAINYYVLSLIFLIILLSLTLEVEANVTVNPTRLILENGQRSATIKLINPDQETATYRISLINLEMKQTGDIEELAIADNREERIESHFARDLIRYSPRQVVLPPRQAQVVRIQLMIPFDLNSGEYRAHMLFQEIPDQGEQGNGDNAETGINIALKTVYGVSIPIIIRHGETGAELEITDLELSNNLETKIPELALTIIRTGNQSEYGDIEVSYFDDSGEKKLVGAIRGTAIYTDIEKRKYKISLKNTDSLNLDKGVLEVIYKKISAEGGEILARNELKL
ncbi:molecular chaperone [Halanaerobium sp. ST460_2HS_T2]|uniref:fimbrial biogenesis chaperone n=1 Tax=Halanaerobium sp. ST460_2HS_T2 TaxID=2183914 RepID=UPI000DF1C534|nr:molecular chaperone [Halanaerobium sp. ST460_2HS_T2]RCW60855.1 P pilus assembly chaperone PapD [Halanaerobium sp. ST460_2HS_T2]